MDGYNKLPVTVCVLFGNGVYFSPFREIYENLIFPDGFGDRKLRVWKRRAAENGKFSDGNGKNAGWGGGNRGGFRS